ncbi:MAG: sulfatase [Candidatus Aminicenantes bacterium]
MTKVFTKCVTILMICAFFLTNGCVNEGEKFEFYRFIDHLDNKNIISSPLIQLEKNFAEIEEFWSREEFTSLRFNEKEYWAVSTQFPVLTQPVTTEPIGMCLFKDGEEIAFSTSSFGDSMSWSLIKSEMEILPRKLYPAKRKGSGIVLSHGESIDRDIVLPRGDVIFEIFAASEELNSHCIDLVVFLDDQKIDTLKIRSYKPYRLVKKVNLGTHTLKLVHSKYNSRKQETQGSLSIDKIRIKALNDILIISGADEIERKTGIKFKASYYQEPADRLIVPIRSEGSGQNLEKEIAFEFSGKKQIEIIGRPKRKNSSIALWLGEKRIEERPIPNLEWSSQIFETRVLEGTYPLKIKGEFITHAVILENPAKNTLLPVWEYSGQAEIHDSGIGNNPYLIKKKLVVTDKAYGQSINAVFAPPKSVFEFHLKIPESSVLEFGYGLLDRAYDEHGDGVNFVVQVENQDEKTVLFSRYLDPWLQKTKQRIFHEGIDLSSFHGKEVKISFITEGFPPDRDFLSKYPDLRNDLSFWFNPVIFKKPDKGTNVILISIDTLRADHLGCYGYKRNTSSHVDELAEDGVLFLNTFCDSPWTLPSHVSMLTSLNALNHGVNDLDNRMPSSLISLADLLRKNSVFSTAFTGGGKVSARFGLSKGFDSYGESKGTIYEKHAAERLFKRTARWIDKNGNKNFFLFLHTYQVHGPYIPPPPFDDLFLERGIDDKPEFLKKVFGTQRNKFREIDAEDREAVISLYDGGIRYTDEYLIGPLIKKLKELDLYDRTMIIFTSDHGEEFYEHRGWEHSHSLYNELIKIPLVIKFPDSRFRGEQIDNIVRLIDIVPTVLDVLEIENSESEMDGDSLIRLINGKDKGDREFLSYLGPDGFPHVPEKISINNGSYKLILNHPFSEEDRTYFIPPPATPEKLELYHLENDPLEEENLSHNKRIVTQELLHRLDVMMSESKERKVQEKAIIDEELKERLRALGYIK